MDDLGSWVLALGGLVASVFIAWLTARGARGAARETAEATKAAAAATRETAEAQDINARIKIMLDAYQADREDDAKEIFELKEDLKLVRRELEEVKRKFPLYHREFRRLRKLVTTLGGDPGPWPEGLD